MTDNSLWDPTWQMNRHSTKLAHMQGATILWNQYTDPIRGENLMKFIHETNTKDNFNTDKISLKNDTKCIIYTHRRSDRPIRGMKIMHIDSLGNTNSICTLSIANE